MLEDGVKAAKLYYDKLRFRKADLLELQGQVASDIALLDAVQADERKPLQDLLLSTQKELAKIDADVVVIDKGLDELYVQTKIDLGKDLPPKEAVAAELTPVDIPVEPIK